MQSLCIAQDDFKGKFTLSAYGILQLQVHDYGPNQRATLTGATKTTRATIDIPKFVFAPTYYYDKTLFFEAEVEFEHGGTGSALELEYEEFGEYEFESERAGVVQLEEFHINKTFSEYVHLRIGRFPLSLTLYNDRHRPLGYFATVTPESEYMIIPSVWTETGLEVSGHFAGLQYAAAVVNGLDASGFSSERWIGEGKQGKFETVKITNPAFVGKVDYTGITGLTAGIGFYTGNSAGNRPKPEDMSGYSATVNVFSLHARYQSGPVILRGDYIKGTLTNSDIVSQRNARLSVNIQAPRSPVAKAALAYYAEGGYNIAPFLSEDKDYKVFPFVRYEYYNSMEETEGSVYANPRFKRSLITSGFNIIWKNNIVLKADYASRIVGGGKYTKENTIGLSLAFSTSLLN